VLARAGVASRRKCEALILQGRVRVNGQVVTKLGTKVDPAWDTIEVDGRPITRGKKVYFDCVLSLNKRVRTVIELAFGSGHPYLAALTEKHDGVSLSDIRSKLAHGRLTLVSKEDKHTVRKRLHEIAHISKEFLMRMIAKSRSEPIDQMPSWSGLMQMRGTMSDPRNILVVSDENMLPTTDWRIRPEWCD